MTFPYARMALPNTSLIEILERNLLKVALVRRQDWVLSLQSLL